MTILRRIPVLSNRRAWQDVSPVWRIVSLRSQLSKRPPLPTQSQISAFMAELGRKGGKIGGKRRLETMSSQERKRIAKKAADARWEKSS